MTISEAQPRLPAHLPTGAAALLRSLLLCQMAEYADQAADCRTTADALTGQADTDSLLERELAETSATSFMVALLEAREALRRLDDGTYGFCEACATPIPYERLEAIPHARHCVSCPATPAGLLG
ncbi:MAG: TraR/DksA family transcriptional regulator [Acidimicrobiia bacterium]